MFFNNLRCQHCNSLMDTRDASKKEGLIFYSHCSECDFINKVTIDIDKSCLVIEMATKDDVDTIKRLYDI